MSEIKNITIAYNPNDFFYYKSPLLSDDGNIVTGLKTGDPTFDIVATCTTKKDNATNDICRINNVIDNDIKSCYDRELCINRDNALRINKLQTNHDGSSIRKEDVFSDYNRELLKSYNLAIGSLGIIIMFYFFYK
jgi:hypothetical protein